MATAIYVALCNGCKLIGNFPLLLGNVACKFIGHLIIVYNRVTLFSIACHKLYKNHRHCHNSPSATIQCEYFLVAILFVECDMAQQRCFILRVVAKNMSCLISKLHSSQPIKVL
jgi:hypothetical protein